MTRPPHRPIELSPGATAALARVSTATLSAQLYRRGYRNIFIRGLAPTRPDLRLVGYAFTLRSVPVHEDVVQGAPDNATNVQRMAIRRVVVIVPSALAEAVAHDAVEQDLVEAFALERVEAGESICDLYPLAPGRRSEFERWRAAREGPE